MVYLCGTFQSDRYLLVIIDLMKDNYSEWKLKIIVLVTRSE